MTKEFRYSNAIVTSAKPRGKFRAAAAAVNLKGAAAAAGFGLDSSTVALVTAVAASTVAAARLATVAFRF